MTDITDHTGLPLTASLTQDVILQIAPRDTPVNRADLIRDVVDEHARRNGIPIRADQAVPPIKGALKVLSGKGLAQQAGVRGYWRILSQPLVVDDVDECEVGELNDTEDPAEVLAEGGRLLRAQRVLGDGLQTVYVYSYPAYRALAELRGEIRWQVKIGMTRNDYQSRIADQLRMGPELPEVHMVVRVDHARPVEQALHTILDLRGRRCPDSVGEEWFWTNPDEIVDILSWMYEGDLPGDATE